MAPAIIPNSTNVRINIPSSQRLLVGVASFVAPRATAEWMLDRMLTTRRRARARASSWFDGEPLHLTLSDGQSAVARAAGSGPVVHLLHGWDGSAADWRTLAPALLAAGFRVVAIEAPGHGAAPGAHSHVRWFSEALLASVETFGVHGVVAHSFGAPAVGLAERAGLAASRVVLLAPEPDPAAWVRAIAAMGGERLTTEMLAGMTRRLRRPAAEVGLAHGHRRPALVVHDTGDRQVAFARTAAVFPDLWRTSDLGHRGVLHHPGVVSAVVAWQRGDPVSPCVHHFVPGTCATCALERSLYERCA